MTTSIKGMLSSALHRSRRDYVILAVLAGIAFALSIIVRHEVFPAYSWNRDEPVYLWQVQLLNEGQLSSTDGGAPEFFRPWLTAARDGTLFSQYTPGWPLALWLSDNVLGSPGYALAFSAALAVLGTYTFTRVLTGKRNVALIAAAIMTMSPIVILQSGIYLGYLFSLALGLFFGALVLTGIRGSPWRLIVAGLLLGLIFLTRPYDAVLWALPIGVYALVITARSEWKTLLKPALWTALGFLPLFVVTLALNKHLTGSFTEFPITVASKLDKFWFGTRRIMPRWEAVDFTVFRAFRGSGRNLFFLPQFLFGSYLALIVAGRVLWERRRERDTIGLFALAAAFPLGYFIFWGIYLSGARVTLTGPIYYVPVFVPIAILMAYGFVSLWERKRQLAIGVVAVLTVATVPFLVNQIDENSGFSDAQAPWRDSVKSIDGRALVIVDRSAPYLLHLNPFSSNPPDLDGRVLYAADRGWRDFEVIADHPDRTPYLQASDVKSQDLATAPAVPNISLRKLNVTEGETVTVNASLTNTTGHPIVVAYLRVGEDIVSRRILDRDSEKGETYETEWTLQAPTSDGDGLSLDRHGSVSIGIGTGATTEDDTDLIRFEDELSYRVVDDRVELLTPGRGTHVVKTKNGKIAFWRGDTTEAIQIRASGVLIRD